MGVGAYQTEKYFVLPYIVDAIFPEQYHDLRTTLLRGFLQTTNTRLVLSNYAGVCTYLYRQARKWVLIVVNSTESDFETTDLQIQNLPFSKICTIHRKNGRKMSVKYTQENGVYKLQTKNEHLSTQTFLLYD
jgi:hypothetical protein